MSYNPARVAGKVNVRNKRRIDPGAGIRRSSMQRSAGPQAVAFQDLTSRVTTPHGWAIEQSKCKDFEVVYLYMYSRNDTGVMKHPEKDRIVYVLAGHVFVTTEGNTFKVDQNRAFPLKAGQEYAISSSGSLDAELLFIQGSDYDRDLIQVDPPGSVHVEALVETVEETVGNLPPKRKSPVSRKNAEKTAVVQKDRRSGKNPVKKAAPLPGQTVIGVNPQPVGAAGYRAD